MFKFTITEETQGYTYATACNADGVEVDIIVYDNSTADVYDIWVEIDDVRNADYDMRADIMGWTYDACFTVAEAIAQAEYYLYKMFK